MNTVTMPTDRDLVRSYAREGSETAFRALVSRHVDLVFATAYRQVGDKGLAEEITQNVFVRLARKSTVLAGHETIVGWLHRCAILESKACFRAEMRRRRREEIAAALAETQCTGRDLTLDLSPLLDEALLQLRDGDRVALVLRFLEERSFREVGTALGVDENAARQRVNRALSKVTEFFRQQGVVLPAAGGAAVLHQSTLAAPVGLASTASAAGLAVGGPASGLGVVLLSIMSLTKTQTALLCGVLVLAPLAWQTSSLATAQREIDWRKRDLARFTDQVADAEQELDQLDRSLVRVWNETASTRAEVARIRKGTPNPTPDSTTPAAYRWDDSAPLVRLPKRVLANLHLKGNANPQGELSPEIRGVLQLTETETREVQSAIDRFTAGYQKLVLDVARPVEPSPRELEGRSRDQVLVLEFKGLEQPAHALYQELLADLGTTLNPERLKLLKDSWRTWMSVPGESSLSTLQEIFAFDHRVQVSLLGDFIFFGVSQSNSGAVSGARSLRNIPHFISPIIQPWLEVARQSTPAPPATATPTTP